MNNFSETELSGAQNFIFICQRPSDPGKLSSVLTNLGCSVALHNQMLIAVSLNAQPDNSALHNRINGAPYPAQRTAAISPSFHTGESPAIKLETALFRESLKACESIVSCQKANGENLICLAIPGNFTGASEEIAAANYEIFQDVINYASNALSRLRPNSNGLPSFAGGSSQSKKNMVLTPREKQILGWISQGKGCWETGSILGISERTVKFHLQNIYRKLNVVNRAQAITKALQHSLM